MSTCQACQGRAELWLCRTCTTELAALLRDLPWWIDRLIEAAVGDVRLGDGGRTSAPRGIRGDDTLASQIEPLPSCHCDDECHCDPLAARRRRERVALAHALSIGHVNASASELHDDVRNGLSTWIRHLCEHRGIDLPHLSTAPDMARWLHRHVDVVALDEAAGEILDELTDMRQRVERTINRPIPRKWLGYCPTWNEGTRKACGRELWAPGDAIETWCRDCRTTHNCNRLQLLLVNDMAREKVSIARVRELNRKLPEEYRVPERTLRDWVAKGQLRPRGYQRPDGSRGIARHSPDDVPLYLWDDIQKLRAMPQGRRKTPA